MPTAESTDSAARAEDYVARGRIVRVGEDRVVFNPLNFNYELELETPSAASLKDRVGLRIECGDSVGPLLEHGSGFNAIDLL